MQHSAADSNTQNWRITNANIYSAFVYRLYSSETTVIMSFTCWVIFHLLIMLSPAQKQSPTDDCKFLYICWFMEIGARAVCSKKCTDCSFLGHSGVFKH